MPKMQEEPMQILVVAGGGDPVDAAFAALRERGIALSLHLVWGEDELRDSLPQRPWDLVVCFDGEARGAEAILAACRELRPELPLIAVLPAGQEKRGLLLLQAGAVDGLCGEQWERLAICAERAAAALRLERRARRLDLALRELEDRHRKLLENSSDPFAFVQEGMHLYCNPAYAAFFGYADPARILDIPLLDLCEGKDRSELKTLLASGPKGERRIHLKGICHDGSAREMALRLSPMQYQGREALLLAVSPAAGNREYALQLEEIEASDLLTRLHNRGRFIQGLEEAIRSALEGGDGSTLLVVRLDEFTDLEQSLGKARANRVLAEVGDFLRGSIKKPFLAARLDEHEFGLLLEGGVEEGAALADFIRDRIGKHLVSSAGLSGVELGCSVGAAAINSHAQDAASLLARARANLDAHHDDEGYRFRIGDTLQPRLGDIVRYLEGALEDERFRLVFQPIVNLKGEGPRGYEVLCRLLDSDDNLIPPSAFITAADLHGLGEALDRSVLTRVMQLLAKSGKAGNRLLVNLCRNTVSGKTFLPWLNEALARQATPPDLLIFQLSEIELCRTPGPVLDFCRGLKELGLARVLTDFGCATDPFSRLEDIAPEYVVLDESLLKNMLYSQEQKRQVRAMVDALHKLSYPVAAPRVEDVALLPILWEIGVDLAQGYCLQAPSQEMDYEFIQEQEITLAATLPR